MNVNATSTPTNTNPTNISPMKMMPPARGLSPTNHPNDGSMNNACCEGAPADGCITPQIGSKPLSEAERRLIEHVRTLQRQDPAFANLATAINDCLAIMQERGGDYNGEMSGVQDQIYEFGDVEAYIHTKRPIRRLKQILSSNGLFFSDAKVKDKIVDAINYALMWLCCREARRNGQAQNR